MRSATDAEIPAHTPVMAPQPPKLSLASDTALLSLPQNQRRLIRALTRAAKAAPTGATVGRALRDHSGRFRQSWDVPCTWLLGVVVCQQRRRSMTDRTGSPWRKNRRTIPEKADWLIRGALG